MRNKKADLSLSTNAIVVLIIAITMLGLALGFTRGIFSSLGEKIKNLGGQTIIENPATLEKPITFTNDKVEVRRGANFDLGISIFNRYDLTYDYSLTMDCVDEQNSGATELFTFIRPGAKKIQVNKHVEFSTTIKVSQDAEGIYSCTITADSGMVDEEGNQMMEQKDLMISVI